MQNLSCENEFDLHENQPVGKSHFHMNSFARRLALTQNQKATRKWPIDYLPKHRSAIGQHIVAT